MVKDVRYSSWMKSRRDKTKGQDYFSAVVVLWALIDNCIFLESHLLLGALLAKQMKMWILEQYGSQGTLRHVSAIGCPGGAESGGVYISPGTMEPQHWPEQGVAYRRSKSIFLLSHDILCKSMNKSLSLDLVYFSLFLFYQKWATLVFDPMNLRTSVVDSNYKFISS